MDCGTGGLTADEGGIDELFAQYDMKSSDMLQFGGQLPLKLGAEFADDPPVEIGETAETIGETGPLVVG